MRFRLLEKKLNGIHRKGSYQPLSEKLITQREFHKCQSVFANDSSELSGH